MTRTIVDIHVLQTVPPSNLNRDDTGSPKTAVYGGVRRSRVSSQAWKRATRVAFKNLLNSDELGVRTKRVVELLDRKITELAPDLDARAEELAKDTLKAVGIKTSPPKKNSTDEEDPVEEAGYLVFLSARQIHNLAEAAVAAARAEGKIAGALKQHNVKAIADREHSVDIALFGRMIADVSDFNVDAAAQVAHAVSVHPVENEYDYFTAVDDRKEHDEQAGAGMIGTVEFNSATLYRYATVDVDLLAENLGNTAAARRALETFVRAFVTSMPTGKQNTFANRTLPDVVLVKLRDTQPISFVGAFEEPVTDGATSGRVQRASELLAGYAADVEQTYGEQAVRSWVVRVGSRTKAVADIAEEVAFEDLIRAVGEQVTARAADAS